MNKDILLILGGTGKIGLAISKHFLELGWNVISVSRNPYKNSNVLTLEKEFEKKFIVLKADVTKERELFQIYKYICKNYSAIKVLVNCIGGLCKEEKIQNVSLRYIQKIFKLNLFYIINSARIFLPIISKGGVIINFSGGGAIADQSNGKFLLYPSAKTALLRFTEILSNQLVNDDIGVFAVDPGWVPSPEDWEYINKEGVDPLLIRAPNETAHLIEYLTLNNNKFLSGRLFRVFDDYKNVAKKMETLDSKENLMKIRLMDVF